MKRFLFFVFLLSCTLTIQAQEMPRFGEIPEAYQPDSRLEYNRALRQASRLIEELQEQQWEIIPDEYFLVSFNVQDAAQRISTQAIDHWAKPVMLPEGLVERMLRQCTRPGRLDISDNGVDQTHFELRGPWWLPASNYTGTTGIGDHGTHVAGLSLSILRPLLEAGIITMKSTQNLAAAGQGSFAWATTMVATERASQQQLIDQGGWVTVNMSWGYTGAPVQAFEQELKKSAEAGVVFVAAAGNTGGANASYPVSSPHVIGSASLDPNMQRSSYSNIGPYVDFAMPGRNLNSTLPNNRMGMMSGTSMASPLLAAVVSITQSAWDIDPADVSAYLTHCAQDIDPTGYDEMTGYGFALITKILDTDPKTVLDPDDPMPPDDPPAEPPTDPDLAMYSSEDGGYMMRWAYEGEQSFRLVSIPYFTYTVVGPGPTAPQLYDDVTGLISDYFQNRAIVIPKDMDANDVIWWTGQFMEYIMRDFDIDLDVELVRGQDEMARTFLATGFDRAQAGNLSEGPALIDVLPHR